jgi:hypothetical protein
MKKLCHGLNSIYSSRSCTRRFKKALVEFFYKEKGLNTHMKATYSLTLMTDGLSQYEYRRPILNYYNIG